MAGFAAQAALRAKWSSLVEEHSIEVPPEVTNKVTTVVGWLKQASLDVRAAGRRAVNTLASSKMSDSLVILHYNDVYNVEARQGPEPIGGAARFCTAIKSLEALNPLVLFSGDAFSPSMLSTFTKGEHMVPVLNEIGTHCAVLGNHDFDHGLEMLSKWVEQSNFPWLMSNVVDNETGRPLGEGRITHVVNWGGRRIGLVGLVEKEWLDTLATINPEEVTFLDFVEAGQKLAAQLKQEQILEALENAVCMYPKLEGRFPQVAGLSFAFNPNKPPGTRVEPQFVRIGDEYLNVEQNYCLATKSYMHNGCDGYVMLRNTEVLVNEGECPELGLAVQNHFQAINMRLGKTRRQSKHRQSLVTLSRRHSLVKMLDGSELEGPPILRRASTIDTTSHNTHHTAKLTRRASLDDLEQETCQLIPKIDQRIIVITSEEKYHELVLRRQRVEQDSIIEEVDECSPQN
ncbi:hypothetical protein HUJ05_012639 [Dendroctonus ponderosae]|nr:hypothetical protein HUJ05_012639 [Dendroctonus ponderosae]